MAYKYTTGSTFRGDIYAEDDAQSNTYIDWTPHGDSVGIVAGGTTMLVVSSSTVGVGALAPSAKLHVSGASTLFRVDELSGAVTAPALFVTSSAALGSCVAIGTATPTSTFQVSGSETSNYTSFTADVTLNKTHHVVAFTGDTGVTGTLPAVAGCTGRIYHVVNSLDQDSNPVVVKGNSSENVGNANTLDLDAGSGNSSVMIVSNGSSWVILGKYSESDHGNGNGE